MLNPVIIFGANNLAKVALDILQQNNIIVYGFLDNNTELHNTEINHVSVLGKTNDQAFLKLIGRKCDAFIATDDIAQAKDWAKLLEEKRKVTPINVVHPLAHIASDVKIGNGNLIQAQSIINVGVVLGNHINIGIGAKIDTSTKVGNFVQIGMGANIGADVEIAEGAFIGAGVTLISGIKIAENARIGAGSVVIQSIEEGETFFGNPAQKVTN